MNHPAINNEEDLTLQVNTSLVRAVELVVQRAGSDIVNLSLSAQEALDLADMLQRYAHMHVAHIEAFVDRNLPRASLLAAPTFLQ